MEPRFSHDFSHVRVHTEASSAQSFPASNQRQFYVSVSRGKEQALVFTNDKKELLKAVEKGDEE